LQIALFFPIIGSFGGFNILGFDFYIRLQFWSAIQPHCPMRMRKVLLVALPAKPPATLIAPEKKPPLGSWRGY
jgi:hypothetical protein